MTVCVTAPASGGGQEDGASHAMTVARSGSLAPRPASDTDNRVSTLCEWRPGTATCHTGLERKLEYTG